MPPRCRQVTDFSCQVWALFNVAQFSCLSTAPDAKERTLWSKTAPYLKLPTVSSPALTKDGYLVFGDGMHQPAGATLHGMTIDSGLPVWDVPVPGKLVHLEGSPTILGNRVYLGGGAAGAFCVELDRAKLDGKVIDLPGLQKAMKERWQALLEAYQKDKIKNEFAVPPTDDQLPRPEPKQEWRQGEEKWHVDAPVAVVGDQVLVASAFLNQEKVGDRAVFSLDVKDGKQRWRTPLEFNPWGGPSVLGKTVVVGASTIGYDTKAIKGAKGEIMALDLDTGKVQWRKPVKGGIVSTVALTGDLAIATATDGKVRAFELADGSQRWNYDAGTPVCTAGRGGRRCLRRRFARRHSRYRHRHWYGPLEARPGQAPAGDGTRYGVRRPRGPRWQALRGNVQHRRCPRPGAHSHRLHRRPVTEKGDRAHLLERPKGCFAQMSPVPFFGHRVPLAACCQC